MLKETNAPDFTLRVGLGDEGRIDRFLVNRFPDWSRTALQKLINNRYILIDNHAVSPNHKLLKGQTLSIRWPKKQARPKQRNKSAVPYPLLFEDDEIFVVNKPPGVVVHPAAGHMNGDTLIEIVAPHISSGPWPDEMRPGLVHRLDRDTSGVLILAKTPESHAKLSLQFSRRQVKKTYLALVKGRVTVKEGTIESHLGRHPGKRQRFAVASTTGRWSVTKFIVREHIKDTATLLELHPLTGRTHQIRVHLQGYGHPIIGDHVYGAAEKEFSFVPRQLLHAFSLQVTHPITKKVLFFEAPLPDDFQESLKLIRLNNV